MTQSEVWTMFIRANPGVRRPYKKGYWYRCAHCGKWCGRAGKEHVTIPDSSKLEIDHIRSLSQGGSDELWNLQPLCKPCSRSKSNNSTFEGSLKIIKNDLIHRNALKVYTRNGARTNALLKRLVITKRR